MKHALLISDWISWADFRPSKTFLRKAAMMVGMYALLTLGTYAAVTAATAEWLPTCASGMSILEYPRYDARGVVVDSDYVCGAPKRVCLLKKQTAKGPLYECPGLMKPITKSQQPNNQ
jgi:hypothetical protein